jgi:hypothetical protein
MRSYLYVSSRATEVVLFLKLGRNEVFASQHSLSSWRGLAAGANI